MDLSVVVPAYREGTRIYDNLRRLLGELDLLGTDYEVVVVSDGNRDATASEAQRVGSSRVSVIEYSHNMGKGYALTTGARHSNGELIIFIDADMELHPKEIRQFVRRLREQDLDLVIGSKRHPDSRVHYPLFRRVQSLVYQLLIRVLFQVGVQDTQTGLKLFRREVLESVLPRLAVKQFAFDLELLVVARHLGFTRIGEAPIELAYQFSSTVSPRAVYKILWDTAAIFYRLHVTRYYDQPHPWSEVEAPVAAGSAHRAPVDAVRRS